MRPAWQVDLGRRWTEPHRCHHDIEHLREVLTALEILAMDGLVFNARVTRRAAWFHDAVYDVFRDDNEEASADLARHLIRGTTGERIAAVVMTTKTHQPGDDPEAVALCDADLAVLGSGRQRYARYCQEIRNEYAHVPERQFRSRRAEALTTLLKHEHLFASPQGRSRWEAPARRNVDAEIRQLVPLNSV